MPVYIFSIRLEDDPEARGIDPVSVDRVDGTFPRLFCAEKCVDDFPRPAGILQDSRPVVAQHGKMLSIRQKLHEGDLLRFEFPVNDVFQRNRLRPHGRTANKQEEEEEARWQEYVLFHKKVEPQM
jgi:hypothetical protein